MKVPWKPMSSAPQTGERLLVWMDGRATFARWDAQKWSRRPEPYWSSDYGGVCRDRRNPPVAWTPHPAAPEPHEKEDP